MPFILMEWRLTVFYDKPETTDWMLVNRLIHRLVHRGYEVFDARYIYVRLDNTAWGEWPHDVVWKQKDVKFY